MAKRRDLNVAIGSDVAHIMERVRGQRYGGECECPGIELGPCGDVVIRRQSLT